MKTNVYVFLVKNRDLYDQQRLDAVVNNLFSLSAAARKIKTFQGPFIGVKYAEENKRQFTAKQLNSAASIPAWSRGDIQHKTSNMDGMGIIKVFSPFFK